MYNVIKVSDFFVVHCFVAFVYCYNRIKRGSSLVPASVNDGPPRDSGRRTRVDSVLQIAGDITEGYSSFALHFTWPLLAKC